MKTVITISGKELETAISDYVEKQGVDLDGKNVAIDLGATRKPVGFQATITLVPEGEMQEEVVTEKVTAKSVEKLVEKTEVTNTPEVAETVETEVEVETTEAKPAAKKASLFAKKD